MRHITINEAAKYSVYLTGLMAITAGYAKGNYWFLLCILGLGLIISEAVRFASANLETVRFLITILSILIIICTFLLTGEIPTLAGIAAFSIYLMHKAEISFDENK